MTARLAADSLVMWSAQVALLVAIAALACRWLPRPDTRLLTWQVVLAAALLLPFLLPKRLAEPIQLPETSDSGLITVRTHAIEKVPAPEPFWRGRGALLVLGVVAFARMCWLLSGLFKLRQMRSDAEAVERPPMDAHGAADWFISDSVPGPVTFGRRRPAILLPRWIVELPADLREAVAAHELAHVHRRDWMNVLAEETLRSFCWFHPAVWYALREIQIAREEVVDAEAVRLTRDRDRYLDALLAVAGQRVVQDLAPAPLFLKKRQLARRVASLVKDTSMSRLHMTFRLGLVAVAALAGFITAAWLFPLPSAAQAVTDDPGITVLAGGPLMHRPAVHLGKIAGLVVLDATLDAKGEVTDAHVVSGPEELRRDALASVLQWHYVGTGSPSSVGISIQFGQPPAVSPVSQTPTPAIPPRAVTVEAPKVSSIQFDGVDPGAQEQIRSQLPLHAGDSATPQAMLAASAALQTIDSHLRLGVKSSSLSLRNPNGAAGPAAEVAVVIAVRPVAPAPSAAPVSRDDNGDVKQLRVGGEAQAMNLVTKVPPVYPPLAKQARIQGTVRLAATINTDGAIQELIVISGHPLLAEAAMEAVRQWVYKPTLLNGQPVEVRTEIEVSFTLTE